jgi:hypothetical protein
MGRGMKAKWGTIGIGIRRRMGAGLMRVGLKMGVGVCISIPKVVWEGC